MQAKFGTTPLALANPAMYFAVDQRLSSWADRSNKFKKKSGQDL
jgi:hypothetical protein